MQEINIVFKKNNNNNERNSRRKRNFEFDYVI